MADIPAYVLEGDEIDPDTFGNPVIDALAEHESILDTRSTSGGADTLAQRYTDGRLQVGNAVAGADAVNNTVLAAYLNIGWTYLPLASGWGAPSGGYDQVTYRSLGNICFVTGSAQNGATMASGAVIGTLPAGSRPAVNRWGSAAMAGFTVNVSVRFMTDGQILLYDAINVTGRVLTFDAILRLT